ncbi:MULTISPECIES: cyclic nucleotide-binding domain-containing protein [Pseudovibrio]|uniref:cyclic nucleotide-binding domain-containing protein n=1 Tax=Stappiaceae TaxID=2821832 RepID=UPI002366A92E|nr:MULTISPECIES: cyclic nucleotide-binding domain-containing protein [Pseudovibrio]MDD7909709.1 cyclic nucleotide-binding domain-containing protein [Pseudovibrio exalbescens]MDX5592051.1 cyclic nucleotide-binding domain-containing protein [Pseudovibrio sp. SPO723]
MSLARDISVLRRVPMLSTFSDDQLRLLAFSAESVSVPKGRAIFEEGERAEGGIVIAEGSVRLETGMGDQAVQHGTYGEGTLLGESALLAEGFRPVRAVALEDCTLIRIRRALFARMLSEFPEIAVELLKTRSERFAATTEALKRVGSRLDYAERIDQQRLQEKAKRSKGE